MNMFEFSLKMSKNARTRQISRPHEGDQNSSNQKKNIVMGLNTNGESSSFLAQKSVLTTRPTGHMWGNMFNKLPDIPPPYEDWGWVIGDGGLPSPRWISKPVLSRKNHRVLDNCGCQSGQCKPPCICCKEGQVCTPAVDVEDFARTPYLLTDGLVMSMFTK